MIGKTNRVSLLSVAEPSGKEGHYGCSINFLPDHNASSFEKEHTQVKVESVSAPRTW